MSETKQYTWEDLRTEGAKSKDGLLMLIHGKGPSRPRPPPRRATTTSS